MVGLSEDASVILEVPSADTLALTPDAARQLARALLVVADDADALRAAGN